MARKILVVDLCGTIVTKNTTHEFAKSREMPAVRRIIAFMLLSTFGNKIFSLFPGDLQRKLVIKCLTGLSKKILHARARVFAERLLSESVRDEVLNEINKWQARSAPVVVASASLDFIVYEFARALGVDTFVATRLDYDSAGICSGRIRSDSTGSKLDKLRELLGREELEFDVITDNPEDTDLMDKAEKVWFIR